MPQSGLGLRMSNKRTRRRVFPDEMECVVQWSALVSLVAAQEPMKRQGGAGFPVEVMLRIRLMLQ